MQYFLAALKLAGPDERLSQNAALSCEWQKLVDRAESHWARCLESLDRGLPAAPGVADYADRLRFEVLCHLGALFYDGQKWTKAVGYLQKAQQLRPDDPEILEKLYHLYQQVRRPGEAHRALKHLRKLRLGDPLLELYELDMTQVNHLNDAERVLAEIEGLVRRHGSDPRLEERAAGPVMNVVGYLKRLCRQQSGHLDKAVQRLRRYAGYGDWPEMIDYLRDLHGRLQKCKRLTARCLLLAAAEPQRRLIRDLRHLIDRDTDRCFSLLRDKAAFRTSELDRK
jgi:tetratricopeptide (TPR) repeat protein